MTHNERVLELLSDGQPHTHHELYALHVMAHSRVSDLRKRGHSISQWRDGGDYWYRLDSLEGAAAGEGHAAPSSEPDSLGGAAASVGLAAPPSEPKEPRHAAATPPTARSHIEPGQQTDLFRHE